MVCQIPPSHLFLLIAHVASLSTYADLAFVPWNNMLPMFGDTWAKYEIETKYTNFFAWHQRLLARPSVKKCLQNIE